LTEATTSWTTLQVSYSSSDRQILATEHGSGVLKRLEEFPGGDAVIEIIADPRLQEAGDEAAHSAATIDKVLLHAANFGDVEMRFNRFAIGPDHRKWQRGSRG
jgi:acyl-CoA hydrolase